MSKDKFHLFEGLYGCYVRMNDRFESVHIWTKELALTNKGRWTPSLITQKTYDDEMQKEHNIKWYYIRNEGYLGNALMWWKKDRNGYTCDITKAAKFTKEEAERICKRDEDSAYECKYIDGLNEARKVIIDSQYVLESKRLFRTI